MPAALGHGREPPIKTKSHWGRARAPSWTSRPPPQVMARSISGEPEELEMTSGDPAKVLQTGRSSAPQQGGCRKEASPPAAMHLPRSSWPWTVEHQTTCRALQRDSGRRCHQIDDAAPSNGGGDVHLRRAAVVAAMARSMARDGGPVAGEVARPPPHCHQHLQSTVHRLRPAAIASSLRLTKASHVVTEHWSVTQNPPGVLMHTVEAASGPAGPRPGASHKASMTSPGCRIAAAAGGRQPPLHEGALHHRYSTSGTHQS